MGVFVLVRTVGCSRLVLLCDPTMFFFLYLFDPNRFLSLSFCISLSLSLPFSFSLSQVQCPQSNDYLLPYMENISEEAAAKKQDSQLSAMLSSPSAGGMRLAGNYAHRGSPGEKIEHPLLLYYVFTLNLAISHDL